MQLTGKALEHEIADVMTIGVVHALEMVDVENHHGQRRASLTRVFDHRRQAAFKRAAIVEPSQRVVKRHLDRLLHGLAEAIRVALLADVSSHPGQELVSVDRPREVVIDAEFESAKNFRAIVRIGNEQDWQIARALVGADLAAQPQAVERARTETDDHEVDRLFARHRQRLAWVGREGYVMIRAHRANNALRRVSLFVHQQQSPRF